MTASFKILAADKLAPEGLEYISSQSDCELVNKPGLSEDELAAIAGDHDGMIVRSGVQVTAKVLSKPGRLKAVARAGVGVDNIDLEAATAAGVLVMNSAEASTISTAEHAFTLMVSLARNIGPAYKAMSEGKWDRSKFTGTQLHGKTLGVVGFGRIGQTVAKRALAFGMQVIAYDPLINAETALDGQVRIFNKFEDILPESEVLTFHVPLNEQTRGMLGSSTFGMCPKGVLVVNASRGGVVDEEALVEAIESGQCGGAALDVFTTEPPAEDSPLRNHPKILTTPHLGASTSEAQQAVSIAAAQQLLTYLRGEGIMGAVNAPGFRVDLNKLQNAFVDLSMRMTKLASPMLDGGIATVNFQVYGSELQPAAGTIDRMGLIGLLQAHLDTPLNVVNVLHMAEQRGIRVQTTTSDDGGKGPRLVIEITAGLKEQAQTRRIVGRVFEDNRPRVIEINGYHMDMVPSGDMILILNEDRPGMIGLVGSEFGQSSINIADMSISRKEATAMMVLKVDQGPDQSMINRLRHRPGMLKVAHVKLPPE